MHHSHSRQCKIPHHRRGSLTDLVAVGACVVCLLAIIPAGIMYSRESARQQRRAQSFHQIGTAVQSYHQTWNAFPGGGRAPRSK